MAGPIALSAGLFVLGAIALLWSLRLDRLKWLRSLSDAAEDEGVRRYDEATGRRRRAWVAPSQRSLLVGAAAVGALGASIVGDALYAGPPAHDRISYVTVVDPTPLPSDSPSATPTVAPSPAPTDTPPVSNPTPTPVPAPVATPTPTATPQPKPTLPMDAPINTPAPTYVKKTLATWSGLAVHQNAKSASFVAPSQGTDPWTHMTISWTVQSGNATSGWGIELVDEATGEHHGIGGVGTSPGTVDLGGSPTGRSFHIEVGGDGTATVAVAVSG